MCIRGAVCCLEATNVELRGEENLMVLSFAFLSAHTNIPFDNSRSCRLPHVCLVSAAGDHTGRGGGNNTEPLPSCSLTSSCYITAAVAEADHQMETFSNLSFPSRGWRCGGDCVGEGGDSLLCLLERKTSDTHGFHGRVSRKRELGA